MLGGLYATYATSSAFYFFNVSLEETLRRHATRPLADAFGPDELAGWYRVDDRLAEVPEHVIDERHGLDEVVCRIRADARL
jgi:hypothetical protein